MPKIDKNKIRRILVITLSNIGDIVLTTPVIEVLLREFPQRKVDVMVGPAGEDIFRAYAGIDNVFIYKKKSAFIEKYRLFLKLRRMKYDLVVDLKNTMLPFLVGARYKTDFFRSGSYKGLHKKEAHLKRLDKLGINTQKARFCIPVTEADKKNVGEFLAKIKTDSFVVVSPGAKSHIKRWSLQKNAELCDRIKIELGHEVILIGDKDDVFLVKKMMSFMRTKPLDLTEKTNIRQLAYLIEKSELLITNDSAPLHVASAVNARTLAFFGPTDEKKYGPLTSVAGKVLRGEVECAPCEVAQCLKEDDKCQCLNMISVDEAFNAVRQMLTDKRVF